MACGMPSEKTSACMSLQPYWVLFRPKQELDLSVQRRIITLYRCTNWAEFEMHIIRLKFSLPACKSKKKKKKELLTVCGVSISKGIYKCTLFSFSNDWQALRWWADLSRDCYCNMERHFFCIFLVLIFLWLSVCIVSVFFRPCGEKKNESHYIFYAEWFLLQVPLLYVIEHRSRY